jgi:hypothetical protein
MAPAKSTSKRPHPTDGPRNPKKAPRKTATSKVPAPALSSSAQSGEESYNSDSGTSEYSDVSASEPAVATKPRPSGRPPPIHLEADWGDDHFLKYEEYCTGLDRPFTCKHASRQGGLILRAHSLQDHQTLLLKLRDAEEEFTTHAPSSLRTERFVATRVPASIPTERIVRALHEAGLPVTRPHTGSLREEMTANPAPSLQSSAASQPGQRGRRCLEHWCKSDQNIF